MATTLPIHTGTNGGHHDPYHAPRQHAAAGAADADPAAAECAFAVTYAAYHNRVFYRLYHLSAGNRDLAQDLTQDVFVRAWRAWDDFEPRQTLAWLLCIAQRVYVDWWRHDHVILVRPWTALLAALSSGDSEAACSGDSEAAYSGDHAAESWPSAFLHTGRVGESTDDAQPELEALGAAGEAEIRRVLDTLPPRQALALRLRADGGLSYDEIAAWMGATRSAVKSVLHHGRMALRAHIARDGEPACSL